MDSLQESECRVVLVLNEVYPQGFLDEAALRRSDEDGHHRG
jgi:hypothetical protein